MGAKSNDEIIADTLSEDESGSKNQALQDQSKKTNGEAAGSEEGAEEEGKSDHVLQLTIKLPHAPYESQIMVATQEQVQDLRQSIMESPGSFQYSCFHLEHQGKRINDFVELSEVEGLATGSELKLIEDPYTEKEARLHLLRTREIIGASGDRTDNLHGISAGLSFHDTVCPWKGPEGPIAPNGPALPNGVNGNTHALDDYDFNGPPILGTIVQPSQVTAPKTVKSIGVSAWNPPPQPLRQQGHLLYLQLTTNEGEQYQITSHLSGFYVNKSSNSKFDPFPRPPAKHASAHSLFSLISDLSPSFRQTFNTLQELNNRRDPLASFQLTNALPSCPWLVAANSASLSRHQPDLTRTQEAYLMGGAENTETLRDWNEEIQNTKELPRETVQDRVFRERLMSKIYAEFNDAAARGAVLVARGEVAPLNPTESRDAQIFVWNNVFYSFGADGVGTFTSEGGDEAARVAVGKDVLGVKAVNQLDIEKLATPGTITVDYLGKRLVAQSIVPGIFKQREPDENQVDYGGVEGRDVVADNEAFVSTFSQISKALKVKKHTVWDKKGKEHILEASVETKGLLGTDGRKYILDLYRLTPLDISWLEEHVSDDPGQENQDLKHNYPHRMTVIRSELIDAYWRLKLGEFVKQQVEIKRKATTKTEQDRVITNGDNEENAKSEALVDSKAHTDSDKTQSPSRTDDREHVDISAFSLALNPDVFCGQVPQSDEQKAEWAKDEAEVRAVCGYLREKIIPELLHDLTEGDVGFPMDGLSLSQLMHKRGINMRYLGHLVSMADQTSSRMQALKALAIQEMVARAFKHIAHRYLKDAPVVFATSCLSHLLNCFLGFSVNAAPKAQVDEGLKSLYPDGNYSYARLTPQDLHADITSQVQIRFRYELAGDWTENLRHVQLLRSVSLKLGLQITEKDYQFSTSSASAQGPAENPHRGTSNDVQTNGDANGHVNGHTKSSKKKKKAGRSSPASTSGSEVQGSITTFEPEDIANMVPIIKDAAPKSRLAEEALEAGKISMMQNQKEIGQELLLESLTLHEQIYGILHPEVARVYHQLAMLYFQLDEKNAAIELAHKAVIISERTLGIDSSETILAYLNLALFEHGNRNTAVAISCVRHALELWKIVYGAQHPDSITTLNNAAVMLQQLQFYPQSRLWFETSLGISEVVAGKQSVSTATLLFQLAQALVLDNDHKGAVHRMREAYAIFLAKLGPEDPNTKESEKWLEQLTQNAVSMAKHAKDVQARRVRRIMLNPRTTANLGVHAQPQVGQPSADLASSQLRSNGALDSRSIDELMRFIEGGADSSKTTSKKRSARTNPRRRGGSTVGAAA